MSAIFYRELKGFKYQLLKRYAIETGICPKRPIKTPFLTLSTKGTLIISPGYAWDGPSGPTVDTVDFMRGSLVHDALYQLMRAGILSLEHRDAADRLLQKMCLEDGMSKFRAWYVYHALRLFGEEHAKLREQPDLVVLKAPK